MAETLFVYICLVKLPVCVMRHWVILAALLSCEIEHPTTLNNANDRIMLSIFVMTSDAINYQLLIRTKVNLILKMQDAHLK